MAKLQLQAGTTSKTVKVFVQNNSVTTGAGLTGLTNSTSGLTAYYIREGASADTQISLVSATLGTWTSSGFIVVDATNMPGLYELGIPNAALASGAASVVIYLQGATNMAPVVLEIELTAVNNQSTGFGLVNASANVVQWNGTNVSSPATAGIPDINVKNINNTAAATPGASGGILIAGSNAATTISGLTLSGAAAVTSTPATAGLTVTGGAASTTSGGTSAPAIKATGGAGAASTNGAASGATFTGGGTTTVSGGDGVDMTATGNGSGLNLTGLGTGNGLLTTGGSGTGGDGIQATAGGGVAANIATLTAAITGNITGNLSGSVGSVTGAVGSVTGAVGSVTGNVGGNVVGSTASVTGAVGSVTGNVGGNVTGSVGSISGVTFPTNFGSTAINASGQVQVDGTTALVEAYAAQGAGLTLAEALYGLTQFLGQHSTGGTTTWTVKKRNGSTTAKTYTLDSATAPTSISEAT